jgi:hypothetical protein
VTVSKELSKYKLYLVGVQEVRWESGGAKPAGNTQFPMERGIRIMNYVVFFCVHKRIISAVMRVEFVSDWMSYIILSGRWCDIIVLNVHDSTEDKIHDVKGSFCEELERLFNKFPNTIQKVY